MPSYAKLIARLKQETEQLEQVVERCADIWDQAQSSGDNRYIDGVALNLQSFYTGVERVLELVINEIDQVRPEGANWHQVLLQTASSEIPNLRPAIISSETRNALDRYRGFRHVARNVYPFAIDGEQIAPLMKNLWETFNGFQHDVDQLIETLAKAAQEDSD
jgi:hypothetical protein